MRPVLFNIGSFQVHTFGIVLVVAFVVAVGIARKRAVKFGVAQKAVTDVAFWTLIAGVLGARLAFIVQERPADWYSIQFAGLTSFGGIIGGGLVLWYYGVKHKLSMRVFFDIFAPAFLVAHAIGRVGCLMNGCCFGNACPNLPWGIPAGDAHAISHPAQVYDSLMNIAAFGILLWIERSRALKSGQVFALMLSLHGATRFIYEFWRAGTDLQVKLGLASSTRIPGWPITQAQVAASVLILLGAVLFFVYARKPVMQPQPEAIAA